MSQGPNSFNSMDGFDAFPPENERETQSGNFRQAMQNMARSILVADFKRNLAEGNFYREPDDGLPSIEAPVFKKFNARTDLLAVVGGSEGNHPLFRKFPALEMCKHSPKFACEIEFNYGEEGRKKGIVIDATDLPTTAEVLVFEEVRPEDGTSKPGYRTEFYLVFADEIVTAKQVEL